MMGPKIDEGKPKYKVGSFVEMLQIPVEARPRFFAELPKLFEAFDAMMEFAGEIAAATQWPWYLVWLPNDLKTQLVRDGLSKSSPYWVDDDKGLTNVSILASRDAAPIYDRTVKTH